MKKNLIATVLGTALVIGSLTGCGEAATASANTAEVKTEEAADKSHQDDKWGFIPDCFLIHRQI